ncbi:tigger transposable element-derived protein 1-like [Erpetoichthys calabaricus]|uniref:tigger transposable element-derived protein 1-like n=1 Tax=Erpetoichthys calabaricus TaxID=27687 RepID=UPI0022341F05|nr:tigger transposable element-derived protein 1-like [Erpetoichthys calabaricus]
MPAKRPVTATAAGPPSGTAKRVRKSVTLATKMDIVNAVESGERPVSVSRRLGLPASTVRTIIGKKDIFKKMAAILAKNEEMKITRKRPDIMERMERRLSAWLQDLYLDNTPVSLCLIQVKARSIYDDLKRQMPPEEAAKLPEFKAARGWFHRFQQRHTYKNVQVSRISDGADTEAADMEAAGHFPEDLATLINEGGYSPKQVFNMDEFGLFWKKMPTRTYISVKEEGAPGFKTEKERVTILIGANATGDRKLKPLLVHRSENPRAMNNIVKSRLPAVWKSNRKASITRHTFREYFVDHVIPELREYCLQENMAFKILLVLNNSPAHDVDFEALCPEIQVVFFPPGMTSVLQPMDQGVIAGFKANYHKEILKGLIDATVDREKTIEEYWGDFSVLDAVYSIGRAWQAVTQHLLNGAWRAAYPKAVFKFEVLDESESRRELAMLAKEAGFNHIDEEGIRELIESHSAPLSNEELEEMDRLSFQEENVDDDEEAKKETKFSIPVLRKLFEYINAAEELVMQHDPLCDRAMTFGSTIREAANCYRVLLDTKLKRSKHVMMNVCLKNEKEDELSMEMPNPGPSSLQESLIKVLQVKTEEDVAAEGGLESFSRGDDENPAIPAHLSFIPSI